MTGFLDKVYAARDAASTRDLYDDWAATYDAEIGDNGYATPGRCAEALKQFSQDLSQPVLDFGCGTGLSGLALRLAGCETRHRHDGLCVAVAIRTYRAGVHTQRRSEHQERTPSR